MSLSTALSVLIFFNSMDGSSMQDLVATRARVRAKLAGRFFSALLVSCVAGIGVASAETFRVSGEQDLLDALEISATNQENDVIDLEGGVIELTNTIKITNEGSYLLTIENGTIQPAADITPFRLLEITDSDPLGISRLTLSRMTFKDGWYDTVDGAVDEAGGAAVYSAGIPVQVSDSAFNDNVIVGSGAGGAILVSDSSLFIESTSFENNQAIAMNGGTENSVRAETSGGAIATTNGSEISVLRSVFNGNSASRGGAIAPINQTGTTVIAESTFSNNDAESLGGAIWTRSKIEVALSTFYSNNADTGGGALFFQPLNDSAAGSFLTRNTLVGNTGGNGGDAIFIESRITRLALAANLIIGNSTTGGNRNCAELGTATGTNSENLFALQQNNISDDGTCGAATIIEDGANLFTFGTPQDNGGPTPTIALQPGSIAIDAGGAPGEFGCTAAADQRGVIVIDNCEIGSFEFEIIEFDMDEDGILDDIDNCPATPNPNQSNVVSPGDGVGDACDDSDQDGVNDSVDNCPIAANANQDNLDRDPFGDICDVDIDDDGANNGVDAFPFDAAERDDTDDDGIGNRADLDDDGDSQSDVHELQCESNPLDSTSVSPDADGDGIPDCAEPDGDNDGIPDESDNCPAITNEDQVDSNNNNIGDACDLVNDSQPVTVYQHVNFGGSSLSVGEGDVTFGALRTSSVGNDRISSIEIAPGYVVFACQHGGFGGRCETFTGSVSNLRGINFNDVISSLRVSKVTTLPVTVYQHVNFRGSSLSVGEGDLTFRELRASSVGNDRISAIEIAPGYEVYACQHGGFGGRCETFTGSVSDLRGINFNDVISSLRVQQM